LPPFERVDARPGHLSHGNIFISRRARGAG
jgi:hypothetical protein